MNTPFDTYLKLREVNAREKSNEAIETQIELARKKAKSANITAWVSIVISILSLLATIIIAIYK